MRTTYLDGCLKLQQDRLVDENLACLCAQVFDLVFLQLNWFPRAIPSYYKGDDSQRLAPRHQGKAGIF